MNAARVLSFPVGQMPAPSVQSDPGTWNEIKNVGYFNLPATTGRLGPEWSTIFDSLGIKLSPRFQKLLWSHHFVATTDVVYRIAAVRTSLWPEGGRTLVNFLHEGLKPNNFSRLPVEALCLLRFYFTNEKLAALGIDWIAGSHETVEIDEYPFIGNIVNNGANPEAPSLSDSYAGPSGHFNDRGAIAFLHKLREA